jgi:hypothetical protein
MPCALAMQNETEVNWDDEPVNLRKPFDPERRSGHDRRDPTDSARQMRMEVERESREKIHHLFAAIAERDLVIAELKADIAELRKWQTAKEPVLSAADQVVSASASFTWVIKLIIGITMLIGGLAGTHEILRRWTQ